MLALGWWETRHGTGWGALVDRGRGRGFRRSGPDRAIVDARGGRNLAVFAAKRDLRRNPLRFGRSWTAYLLAMLVYAALSFFIVQHVRHLPPS